MLRSSWHVFGADDSEPAAPLPDVSGHQRDRVLVDAGDVNRLSCNAHTHQPLDRVVCEPVQVEHLDEKIRGDWPPSASPVRPGRQKLFLKFHPYRVRLERNLVRLFREGRVRLETVDDPLRAHSCAAPVSIAGDADGPALLY